MLNSLRSDRRIPKSPPHPVLLGEPERGIEEQNRRQRTKDQGSKRNQLSIVIPAWTGMTEVLSG